MNTKGKVYITGAGCGEADLITMRALTAIRNCDVLIYDDLIADELLLEAPESAELIYVGKRGGKESTKQEDICDLLVRKASDGKNVVRLKGGDPFVFGRGGEEIYKLQEQDIAFEVIPGISSCIAIPEEVGIPVTHRGLSRSFHVITGHIANNMGTESQLPADVEAAARSDGTIVLLMGLSALKDIAEKMIKAGKPAKMPAAVVSGGNAEHPVAVRGTLFDIAERAAEAKVKSPAIIVIGETAALKFRDESQSALDGVRVGVTGTALFAGKVSARLHEEGAKVRTVQRSIIRKLNPPLPECKSGDWLVFTSGNGVDVFFELLEMQHKDIREYAGCHFAIIGKATGARLKKYGIQADFYPEEDTTAGLEKALEQRIRCGKEEKSKVYLLRSAEGDKQLPADLSAYADVSDIHTYTVCQDQRLHIGNESLNNLDYIVFASAGGVKQFIEMNGKVPDNVKCVCIGYKTAEALNEVQCKAVITAKRISADAIVEAILEDHETDKKESR